MSSQPVSKSDATQGPISTGSHFASLPITRRLTLAYANSLIIAILVVIACLAGLLCGPTLYPEEEMLLVKQPTDLFTLFVGLPLLLGSMWLAQRGQLLGLLCWPGVLLYLLYVYLSYAIGVPFSVFFLNYVFLVALTAYTLIGLVASIDAPAVRRRLSGFVPERLAGGILAGMSVLFTLMNLSAIVAALTSQTTDYLLDLPVWIVDTAIVAPAWLVGGILLWQRKSLGYVAGAGLLLLGSLMFVGVIVALVFPVFYSAPSVDVTGILFILIAGLVCFIPLALYARGIVRSGRGMLSALHAGPDA